MTKSEATALLKEGQYLERYPTERVFLVCADGNVFLQANSSDARAHADGKGIDMVSVCVSALETEENSAPSTLEISAEGIAPATGPEAAEMKEEAKPSKKHR